MGDVRQVEVKQDIAAILHLEASIWWTSPGIASLPM
jgi:hypothetical protein